MPNHQRIGGNTEIPPEIVGNGNSLLEFLKINTAKDDLAAVIAPPNILSDKRLTGIGRTGDDIGRVTKKTSEIIFKMQGKKHLLKQSSRFGFPGDMTVHNTNGNILLCGNFKKMAR